MENLKLFLQLYYRPASAMSEIIDQGSWLFAAILVLLVSAAFFFTVNSKLESAYRVPAFNEFFHPDYETYDEDSPAAADEYKQATADYEKALAGRPKIPMVGDYFYKFFSFAPGGFYQPLISLSIFYVPVVIILISLFGAGGSVGTVLQRSYGETATCSLMAWAAAHLPFAVVGILLYGQTAAPEIFLLLWFGSSILFGVLMVFALRTVLGANYGAAIITVGVSWLALSLGTYIFRHLSPLLFSPFLLFYAFIYLGGFVRGEARGFGNAFRQRQNFKRFLHNATVNPKDADAHVQLGLIYLQRRQEAKALEHLHKAVEIDKTEIDANYELGKLARAKGDFQGALNHFAIVIEQNDKYALSEVWREIGATYLGANMPTEAREALEKFVARRPVDSEGLYYLGKVLKMQGEGERAREMFEQAVESAKNSPDYRRREMKHWSSLAQKEI